MSDYVRSLMVLALVLGGCATPDKQRQGDAPREAVDLADHERIVQIAAGGDHACARAASGQVYCWGKNALGQLGDGGTENRLRPVLVEGIDDAVDITAGGAHSCAVHDDGTVSCWGLDSHGQLGQGQKRRGEEKFITAPAKVVEVGAIADQGLSPNNRYGGGSIMCRTGGELGDVIQVEAGVRHTCALHKTGAVLCWGENDNGGGLGTMWERDGVQCPMPVWNVEEARQIAASSSTTCAVLADGKVRCWGSPSFSMMSDFSGESVPNPYSRMVEMRDLDDALAVSMGAKHVCAVRDSGELACWGSNYHQTLRASSERQIADPLTIEELGEVVDADTAGAQQCAVREDGSVWCWGGDKGKIQPDARPQQTAVRMPGLDDVVQVRLGGYAHVSASGYAIGVEGGYGCALDRRGRVRCWGQNGLHLGDGSDEGRSEPRPVDFAEAFAAAADAESEDASGDALARQDGQEEQDACSAQETLGDPSSPNSLTLRMGDKQRTFYFDRSVAEIQGGKLVISFPKIQLRYDGEEGVSRHWSPRIAIELAKGSASDQTDEPLRAHTLGGPDFRGWDCMNFLPRQYGKSTLRRYLPPEGGHGDGLVDGEFSLYAGSPELGAITGEFRIRNFVRPPLPERGVRSDNAFLYGDAMKKATSLTVTHKPAFEQLSIEMTAPKSSGNSRRRRQPKAHFVLRDFPGEPGTYEFLDKTFVIEEFVAGVARGEIYEMRQVSREPGGGLEVDVPDAKDSKDSATNFFDAFRDASKPAQKEKVVVATFSTDRVFTRPQLGSVTQTMPAPQDHREGPSRDSGNEPDTAFELSPTRPLEFTENPQPVRLVFESRRKRVDAPIEWMTRARAWGGWQIRRVDDAGDPSMLYTFFARGSRGFDDDITLELDEGSFFPRRYEMQLDAKYSVRALGEVDEEIEAMADPRGLVEAPITLEVEFGDGEVILTAENRVQGRDSLTMDVPEHTFHESQMLQLVEYLPLEPGYTTEFHLLSVKTRFGSSGMSLKPELEKVELSVIGEKSVHLGADSEPVNLWMVQVGKHIVFVDADGEVVGFRHGWRHFDRQLRTTP